ncbi:hypothetical protein ACFL1Q_00540 [Patescibacteria group bacterium]
MVPNIGKVLISVSLLGLVVVGVLLLTNHPGFAIKITNYIFLLLLIGVTYETIFKK